MKQILIRLCVALVIMGTVCQAQTLPKETRNRIMKSVVEVLALENDSGAPTYANQGGSGTIISTSGYLLTNYHVIFDDETNKEIKRHAIRFTDNPIKAPVIRGIATIAMTIPKLDLALLKITQDENGKPLDANTKFVASPVGNPFDLIPGEQLTIAGYPDIGGQTITFTTGIFSGWVGENNRTSGTNWMKTDGKISAGNSGGGAFDQQGNLIGVPTAGIVRRVSATLTEIQNYLRPIHLAYALFDAQVPDVNWAGNTRPAVPADVDATGLLVPVVAGGLLPAKPNQVWKMTIEGMPTWTMNLTRLDKDGDPTGTASQAGINQQFIAYAYQDEDQFLFHVESQREESFACVFEDPIKFQNSTLSEGVSLNSPPTSDSWRKLEKSCTVTLETSAVVATPSTPELPKIGGGLTASFPPKPGQIWTVTIATLEPWRLEFNTIDADGDPTGNGFQGSFKSATYAFTDDEKSKVFQFFGSNGAYWCVFPEKPIFNGAIITNGEAYFRSTSQQTASKMNQSCSATLISLGNPTVQTAPLEPRDYFKVIHFSHLAY